MLLFSGRDKGCPTSQLFLPGPVANGVDQGPQPGIQPRAQLQVAGVPHRQPGREGGEYSLEHTVYIKTMIC